MDLEPGDRVRRRATGELGVVQSVEGTYAEVGFGDSSSLVHIDELKKLPSGPLSALVQGEFGSAEAYALRLQALYLRHAYRFDTLSGLSNARIEPALHQVFIAHRVTQKLYPRMILADEVGLGKTIEAGLVIKELTAQELIDRVLIVCPASLQLQWKQELASKFNDDFVIMDGAAVKFLGKGAENPWKKRNRIITSLPFAANPKRAEQIVEAGWDLVVFDEAHRVRRTLQSGSKVKVTQAYELADELKEIVAGLMLLTATPMQLHPFELYSLIELVEPGLYPGFEVYEAQRKQLPHLNELMKGLIGWNALKQHEKDYLVNHHVGLLKGVGARSNDLVERIDVEQLRMNLLDALSERHPLSGVMVRNRKSQVLDAPTKRVAQQFLVELSPVELALYHDVTVYLRDVYNASQQAKNKAIGFLMVTYQKMLASSSAAIHKSLGRRIGRLEERRDSTVKGSSRMSGGQLLEMSDAEELSLAALQVDDTVVNLEALDWEIEVLHDLVSRLGASRDTKALQLLHALDIIFEPFPDEKTIIFTQFVETQEFLAHALRTNQYRVNTFNGGMTLERKEEEVREFRDRGQILISTEAGGEGRNFQFAHVMVNYDMPWNPMKVEQRIGRLDRIGQKRDVYIYNLACKDTVEERVLEVLTERIGLFEESVGSLDPILGEVEGVIERIVMAQIESYDTNLKEYEEDLERRVLEAKEKEQLWTDFAMDRASFRRDEAERLKEESPLARWRDLQDFVGAALNYFGGSLNSHTDGGIAISLSPRLQKRLRLKESVLHGTFDPEEARRREELPFFAFGHELVDSLLSLAVQSEPVEVTARRLSKGPTGDWIEIYWEVVTQGLQPTGQVIRHLVNEHLEVQTEEVRVVPPPGERLDQIDSPSWIAEAVRASRVALEKIQSREREAAEERNDAAKAQELDRARRIYEYQEARFTQLIQDQQSWIQEKESIGTDRDRRVLPARRGQLRRNEERLASLKDRFEQQTEDIKARTTGVEARVLAAGLVTSDA